MGPGLLNISWRMTLIMRRFPSRDGSSPFRAVLLELSKKISAFFVIGFELHQLIESLPGLQIVIVIALLDCPPKDLAQHIGSFSFGQTVKVFKPRFSTFIEVLPINELNSGFNGRLQLTGDHFLEANDVTVG
jgi:hypothetical protein